MTADRTKIAMMVAYDRFSSEQIREAERRLGIKGLLSQLTKLVDDGHFDQLRDVLKELAPDLYEQVFSITSGNPSG